MSMTSCPFYPTDFPFFKEAVESITYTELLYERTPFGLILQI